MEKQLVLSKLNLMILGACSDGIAWLSNNNLTNTVVKSFDMTSINGVHSNLLFLRNIMDSMDFTCDEQGRIIKLYKSGTLINYTIEYTEYGYKVFDVYSKKCKFEYNENSDVLTGFNRNGSVCFKEHTSSKQCLQTGTIDTYGDFYIYVNDHYFNVIYKHCISINKLITLEMCVDNGININKPDYIKLIELSKIKIGDSWVENDSHRFVFDQHKNILETIRLRDNRLIFKNVIEYKQNKLARIITTCYYIDQEDYTYTSLDISEFWK